MSPVALRPRSTTELIDAAIALLRQNYLELVTATAVFLIPAMIIQLALMPSRALVPGQLPTFTLSLFTNTLISVAAGFVLVSMSSAAAVVIVSDNYLGREVSIGTAISRVFARAGAVVGAALGQLFLIMIGMCFLFIGALIPAVWFFATANVVMVEGKGPIASLRRSRELARGSFWHILGTLFLCGLIVMILYLLVGFLAGTLVGFAHIAPQVTTLFGYVIRLFVYPFIMVVVTLLYFDLRIRKEGLDLELMAKELGVAAPMTVPA